MYFWLLYILPWVSDTLFILIQSFISVCLIFESFYCYFFKFTNVLFCVFNPLFIIPSILFILDVKFSSLEVQLRFLQICFPVFFLNMLTFSSTFLSMWIIFILALLTTTSTNFIISVISLILLLIYLLVMDHIFLSLRMPGNILLDDRHYDFTLLGTEFCSVPFMVLSFVQKFR